MGSLVARSGETPNEEEQIVSGVKGRTKEFNFHCFGGERRGKSR